MTYFDTEGKKIIKESVIGVRVNEKDSETSSPKFGKHLAAVHVGEFRACRLSHAGRHHAL